MQTMLSTLVWTVALATACGGSSPTPPAPPPPPPPPPAPIPGDLLVSVSGLATTDGALLMTVGGAPITAVTATNTANRLVSTGLAQTTLRVILSGTLANGDVFKISVPDVAKVSSYTVAIDAVADRETFALGDLSKYGATVHR